MAAGAVAQIEAVLDKFEKTAWTGFEPDHHAWTAVEHRERWTTNMQFVFRDVDPYELTTNPIGLTITYYAADRAVSSGE